MANETRFGGEARAYRNAVRSECSQHVPKNDQLFRHQDNANDATSTSHVDWRSIKRYFFGVHSFGGRDDQGVVAADTDHLSTGEGEIIRE